ncbi:hypothetical protein ABPG77_000672 [Micractinium sp. CCAP 211/92]
MSASIHSLPDSLLSAVLGLVGRSAGPAITLTCRRFRHLYYSEASLWRSYRVAPPEGFSSLAPADQEAWAAAQASRLARVAPLVADVSLVGSQCQLAPFVEVLQPDSLRGLALEWAAPHTVDVRPEHAGCGAFVAAALQRFPVLTGLELSYCLEEAGAAIPAALRSLPALRRLALRLCDVPAELAACAAQLQHLSFLRLAAGGPLPAEPALLQLTRLQHLVHLELADNRFMPGEYPPLPLPAPAECGALLTYDFTCHRGTGLYQVGLAMLQACAFTPEGGGALTLQELAARDGFAASDGTAVLQALLDPLLPGGVPGCRPASLVLDMDFAYLAPLAPLPHERCPVLAHLTRLCLRCCPGSPEDEEIAADMQAFLAASLPRMGRLRQLSLEVHGRQLPESVLALPALHSLVLSGPGLQLMPAGTLLQGLEELTLDSYLPQLPRTLRGARLRRLVLTDQGIRLNRADVEEVLLRLPELRELSLPVIIPGRSVVSNRVLRRLVSDLDELVVIRGGEIVAAGGQLLR